MRAWKTLFTVISAMLYLSSGIAGPSIEGNWITIDDKTGVRQAVANFVIKDGTLAATIAGVFPQPGDTGICSECPGEFKNQPIKGLQFAWGLKEATPGIWDGGHILDAKTGKIYRVKMSMKGDKLYVRGYIGLAMMGRTQIWIRG